MNALRELDAEQGFSLIELLVVIVIVAILAAIAIPVFYVQREKALRSQSESALKNASTAMHDYLARHDAYPDPDDHPGANPSVLTDAGFRPVEDVEVTIEEGGTMTFCLEAVHLGWPGKVMHYSSSGGRPDEGGCP